MRRKPGREQSQERHVTRDQIERRVGGDTKESDMSSLPTRLPLSRSLTADFPHYLQGGRSSPSRNPPDILSLPDRVLGWGSILTRLPEWPRAVPGRVAFFGSVSPACSEAGAGRALGL